MRAFRPWFSACFFWLPLVVGLLLNPGRNGSNVSQFSTSALIALAITSFCLVLYSITGFIQPRQLTFALSERTATPAHFGLLIFSLALGLMGVYSALQGL